MSVELARLAGGGIARIELAGECESRDDGRLDRRHAPLRCPGKHDLGRESIQKVHGSRPSVREARWVNFQRLLIQERGPESDGSVFLAAAACSMELDVFALQYLVAHRVHRGSPIAFHDP